MHYDFLTILMRRSTLRVTLASTGALLPDSSLARTSLTLDSTLESVDRLEREAEAFAKRLDFDEDETGNVAMAIREAAVNAVIHGNAYDRSRQVHASFEATDQDMIFRISDEGNGFDPANIPDPLSPENILRGSGRGIFLMKTFMDEVHFRQLSPGTELTLIKHRTMSNTAA